MKTNILVQYQGGGYDGCFWEWNCFYIDKQGTFRDIESSGCRGIDKLSDALELIGQDKRHTYIYDMSNEQDITTFGKESHPIHVLGVLRWFEDNYNELGVKFFAICSACDGQNSDADDMIVDGDKLLCSECYCIGECPCCESYVGDTEIVQVNPDEHHGYEFDAALEKEHRAEQLKKHQRRLAREKVKAAAPDLLVALKKIAAHEKERKRVSMGYDSTVDILAKNAIAKAKSEVTK